MKEYKQELFTQKTPYLQWLKVQETELDRRYGQQQDQCALGKQVHTLPFSSCMDKVQGYGEFYADAVYLFVKSGGKLSEYAAEVIAEAFTGAEDTVLVYVDEDYRGSLRELYAIGDGIFGEEVTSPYRFGDNDYRGAPWFKPDFSPDTLASFFYIGSVFAVRGRQVLGTMAEYGSDISIYELAYRIFMDALNRKKRGKTEGIVHIPKVLYTNDSLADAERIDSSDRIMALYQAECGIPGTNTDICHDKISIVIPSKDNATVLEKCLETVVTYTNYDCYEIIIVDNGSNPEQKVCITRMIDAVKREKSGLEIRYLYQKSEFNFSAMCNAGAQAASGAYLLFLNDDIEVVGSKEGRDWLGRMRAYAAKSHVGAVGAKLYYPNHREENGCYRIQHAGITNMGIGPAHKLGGMVDNGCLYHGHNTQNYDMLAVTAACMLIRKSVFDEVGGFDEGFPVAYNDVELCFRLYQSGYWNVQVNEAVLVHHESLSRGQDTPPEKQRRLADEKRKLYQKYPLLNAHDPFYSPNLVQWKKDVEYNTGYLYGFDRLSTPVLLENHGESGRRKRAVFKKYDIREDLRHGKCGLAAKIYDRLTGYQNVMFHIDQVGYDSAACDGDDILTIEGWCAVRNTDNADLPRKLWLIYGVRNFDFRSVYEFDIAPKLREDVAVLLENDGIEKGSKNTALSGIQLNIKKSALRAGSYRIGILCDNMLVCDPEKWVTIPDEDGRTTKDREERCDA